MGCQVLPLEMAACSLHGHAHGRAQALRAIREAVKKLATTPDITSSSDSDEEGALPIRVKVRPVGLTRGALYCTRTHRADAAAGCSSKACTQARVHQTAALATRADLRADAELRL